MKFRPLTASHRLSYKEDVNSSRGAQTDKFRKTVLGMVSQVPSFVKIQETSPETTIRKEPFDANHTAYWYTEKLPNGVNATAEFHVDPESGYTEVYVQDDYDGKVFDNFVIEDIEDYNLAEVDRIDVAVQAMEPTKERHASEHTNQKDNTAFYAAG